MIRAHLGPVVAVDFHSLDTPVIVKRTIRARELRTGDELVAFEPSEVKAVSQRQPRVRINGKNYPYSHIWLKDCGMVGVHSLKVGDHTLGPPTPHHDDSFRETIETLDKFFEFVPINAR